LVRITLERPEAAPHLARKLYRAFVAEGTDPGPDLLEPLADVLRSSGYSIRRALEVILRSRHLYSSEAYRRRVKSPVEYTIGLLRMLEIPRPKVNLLAAAAACGRQGQELFAPPNVNGWEGGNDLDQQQHAARAPQLGDRRRLGQPRLRRAHLRPGCLGRGTTA